MAQQPLAEADLDEINRNLEQLNEADAQIRTAEQAGLDVTAFKQQAKEQRQQLLRIKQTYFPGK